MGRFVVALILSASSPSLARGQIVWLSAIQPFTSPDWPAGLSMRFGAEIMLEEINKNPDLLAGYELKIVWQNGECDPAVSADVFWHNLLFQAYKVFAPGVPVGELDVNEDGTIRASDTNELAREWNSTQVRPAPVGLLGPGCSAAATIITGIAFRAYYPLISNSATRPTLSNRNEFPNFFRTLAPDSSFCAAWAAMTKILQMSHMVIVTAETSNWGSMAELMAQEARAAGVEPAGNDLTEEIPGFHGLQIVEDLKAAADYVVTDLKRLNHRVVPLLMFHRRALLIMCEAYRMGFKNAIYFPMWYSFADTLRAEDEETECSVAELTTIAAGSITADRAYWRSEAGLDENTRLACSQGMTAGQFKEEWFHRQGAQAGDYSKRKEGYPLAKDATSTADAVCMFAMALHEMLINRQRPLEHLASRNQSIYSEMQEIFAHTDFEGVQGRIRFGPNAADRQDSYVILQQVHRDGHLVDIASFSSFTFSFFGRSDLVFGFEGEVYHAGPAGVQSISAPVSGFKSCAPSELLNMDTNTCESCGETEEFDPDSATCIPLKETGLEAWHVAVPIACIILVAGCCFYFYGFHMRTTVRRVLKRASTAEMKAEELEKELKSLKDSVVGVRAVVRDYVPALLPSSGPGTSFFPKPAHEPRIRSKWYWQEDERRLSAHNPHDVFQPGNFVSYAGSVSAELEEYHMNWMQSGGPSTRRLNLTNRISSTGNEQKAFAADSGVEFEVDFQKMVQRNVRTGFERKMLRRDVPATPIRDVAPQPMQVGAASADLGAPPVELLQEDFLMLHIGQLVQISKQRPDGWCFGSVVYDEVEERPAIPQEGISSTTGWFPVDHTVFPSNSDLQKFQTVMGGHGADVLAPPRNWQAVSDPLVAQQFPVTGAEKDKVVAFFMQTLSPRVKVVEVLRIQSFSLWQSYAVKRQVVFQHAQSNRGSKEYERVWLFHGTSEEIVDKIIQQGFNRSFCGRNATMYGKGVYFARDASYSANPKYSSPDSNSMQRIFLCRIVVGEYCKGVKDALAPDVREGHHLYDSTVDNMRDPSIFVTYHDAQAYPDYLVLFKTQ